MRQANKRKIKITITIVGEGQTEVAFINHLRSIYGVGSPKITAKSAGGKGPSNVIDDAIGTLNFSGCDRVAALLDTDLPWPRTKVEQARKKKILLIGSAPCIEGLLLKILEREIPVTSSECKRVMHPLLSGNATKRESYSDLFSKDVLDNASLTIDELKKLIGLIKGEI